MLKFEGIRDKDEKAFIGRCTELLPNKMQCYNGADFVISDSADAFEPRQVCRFHAKYLLAQEQEALKNKPIEPEKNEISGETNESAKPSSSPE